MCGETEEDTNVQCPDGRLVCGETEEDTNVSVMDRSPAKTWPVRAYPNLIPTQSAAEKSIKRFKYKTKQNTRKKSIESRGKFVFKQDKDNYLQESVKCLLCELISLESIYRKVRLFNLALLVTCAIILRKTRQCGGSQKKEKKPTSVECYPCLSIRWVWL